MIPVIDLQGQQPQQFAKEILEALESVGFLYLKNIPDLPESESAKVFETADLFWNLNLETKQNYKRPTDYENDGNTGYVGTGVEILDPTSRAEIREAYNITPHVHEKMVFPDAYLPHFRSTMLQFFEKCHLFSKEILRTLALALELEDPEFFNKKHQFVAKGENATTLRLLHYPPLPDHIEPGTARCGAHSDYGTVTMLFQDDIGGLEVMNRHGVWVPAVPEPGAVLLNTGDLLQHWTSDRIMATKHRVLVPDDVNLWKAQRRSLAFFVHPDDACLVSPLDGSKKYQPITAKQHLINMFSKTY